MVGATLASLSEMLYKKYKYLENKRNIEKEIELENIDDPEECDMLMGVFYVYIHIYIYIAKFIFI